MVDSGRLAESDRNPRVEIDAFDLRLPCRAFRVSYKVAEQGKLSLTTEFMLRLLRAADELREDGVAKFFGFNDEEARFAIDQAERFGYVERTNGRVHLTSAGHNLFAAGSDEPALFQVVRKTDKVSFDLISFAPTEPRRLLTKFEFALPELPIASLAEVGQASDRVKQSFQRNFRLIRPKRSGDSQVNSLYTVDSIDAEKRFETVLPVKVSVRPENPTTPEADLLSWKTGGDLDEREAVLNACGNFVRSIEAQTDGKSEAAAKELVVCAPEAAGRLMRAGGFNWSAYFRIAIQRAGRLQIDRQTVSVVGRVWVDANRERLARAAEYSLRREGPRPAMIIWIKPAVANWGFTTKFVEILNGLRHAFQDVPGGNGKLKVLLAGEAVHDAFKHACDVTVRVPSRALAPDLEVLLVPGRLCVVLAHSPVETTRGFPIPMGIVSFEPAVVRRAHELATTLLSGPGVAIQHSSGNSEDAFADIDRALNCMPVDAPESDESAAKEKPR
jgi:hypothetical protein